MKVEKCFRKMESFETSSSTHIVKIFFKTIIFLSIIFLSIIFLSEDIVLFLCLLLLFFRKCRIKRTRLNEAHSPNKCPSLVRKVLMRVQVQINIHV